eukprot:scaffold2785_cov291-Pinguiococcus_pyrenoidosus.AAC.8
MVERKGSLTGQAKSFVRLRGKFTDCAIGRTSKGEGTASSGLFFMLIDSAEMGSIRCHLESDLCPV